MALIPQYDALGNIIGWEEIAPQPTETAPTSAPPPKPNAPSGYTGPQTADFAPSGTPPQQQFIPGTNISYDYYPPTGGPTGDVTEAIYDPGSLPPDTGGPTGGGGDSTWSGGGFEWPMFNAPVFDPGPAFVAPPAFSYDPFSYEAFKAPTLDEAKAEPGYEFARTEGIRGLQNSAASRGVARTGGTLKDLIGWGNRFAEQNYGNVFNRAGQTYDRNFTSAASTYDRNRNNAADAYQTNYGISRDVFDRGYDQRKDKFGFDYQGAKDMFAPKERAAGATFEDIYRRWRDELNATTSIATAGAGL